LEGNAYLDGVGARRDGAVAGVGAGAAAASLVGEDVGWVQAFRSGEFGRAASGGAVGGHTRAARRACPGPKKRRRDGEGEARGGKRVGRQREEVVRARV